MSDNAIELQGVVMGSHGVRFDLAVPHHKSVAVIGEEGSGTDFLCEALLGLEPVEEGEAKLLGENLAHLGNRAVLAFRRKVGYLPEGGGLLQNLSLHANVALPLRFGSELSDAEIDSRVNIILATFRLGGMAHLRPSAASDDQRRRAALARALAFDPKLLLLENPFDGITTRSAREVLEVARGGDHPEGSHRTLFVTGSHLPEILRSRFDAVYRVHRGQVEREDEDRH